ncbi:DUF1579 family protein [Streptomyces rishiriensis]|uniref:DUF1579 family protein n=1 Tax=Streptomyces rishiriensis TaxID=68264 RepID=UPI0033D29EE4
MADLGSNEPEITLGLRGLYEFAGNWRVLQRLWANPGSEPLESEGRTECRVLLDGIAVLMVTEIETGNRMKGVALMTQDEQRDGLTMAWTDTFTAGGITIMTGSSQKAPSREGLRQRNPSATQEREWLTEIDGQAAELSASESEGNAGQAAIRSSEPNACLPESAMMAVRSAVAVEERAAAPMQMRIVENKISNDEWVLDFYMPGPDGNEFLMQENTFLRVTPKRERD